MEPPVGHEVTAWLQAWSHGDAWGLEKLVSAVDRELRATAKRCLRGRPNDPILDTTALIQEAYLRLIGASEVRWQDRAHFFAVCAKIMRHILVDYVRVRRTAKRGGNAIHITLDDVPALEVQPRADLLAIDEALEALSRIDERKARVVEIRFFGGLTIEETAEVLKVSPETVRLDWRLAKAWLVRELGGPLPR